VARDFLEQQSFAPQLVIGIMTLKRGRKNHGRNEITVKKGRICF